MFGIGVYFALQQRNAAAKAGCILLGYAGAVIMHGLWNGSSLLSVEAYFLTYIFWMVPVFALAIVLGVQSRRREQRIVAEKLPGMVAAGLVTPNEATWLGSMRSRKQAIGQAAQFGIVAVPVAFAEPSWSPRRRFSGVNRQISSRPCGTSKASTSNDVKISPLVLPSSVSVRF